MKTDSYNNQRDLEPGEVIEQWTNSNGHVFTRKYRSSRYGNPGSDDNDFLFWVLVLFIIGITYLVFKQANLDELNPKKTETMTSKRAHQYTNE